MSGSAKFSALIVLFILIAIVILAYSPIPPSPTNDLQNVAIEPGQELFAWHYQVGLFHEKQGDLDKAVDSYSEAIKAEQAKIIEAATISLGRVTGKQSYWLYPWQQDIRQAVQTGLRIVLLILAALAIGWLLWLLARWGLHQVQEESGYALLPFEDHTEKNLAKGAHQLLHTLLQKIELTHRDADRLLASKLEENAFPPFGALRQADDLSDNAFKVVEKVKVAGVDVNLASLFKWAQGLLKQKKYTVGAQVYQRENRLWLLAKITEARSGEVKAIWHIEGNSDIPLIEQLYTIVETFAYQFLIENPESALDTQSWHSLRLFTDGLYARQRYVKTTEAAYLDEAVRRLEEAVDIDPEYDAAQYALGGLYHTQGHYRWAEEKFKQVQKNRPDLYLEATYNLGVSSYHQIYAWAKKQAMDCFDEIVAKVGEEGANQREQLLLALTHARMAMVSELEIGRPKKEWTGDAEEKKIDRTQLVEIRARKALSLAEKLSDTQLRAVVEAVAKHAQGRSLSHQAQFLKEDNPDRERLTQQARQLLRESIDLRPSYPVTYISLAQTFAEDSEERLQLLERAVKILPGFEYGQLQLGIAYQSRAEWEQAIEAFRKAPGLSDARNSMGEIYIKKGDYQAAMEQFQAATNLNKRHYFAWHNMAWRTLEAIENGVIPADDVIIDRTVAWSRHALDVAMKFRKDRLWHAYDVLGWALLLAGDYPKSEEALNQALKNLKPRQKKSSLQVHYHLAQLFETQGDPDRARAELDNVADSLPLARGSMAQRIATLQQRLLLPQPNHED